MDIRTVVVFCSVLLFYLHVYFHLKRSNDLEILEIETPWKGKLEEVCDLRQPVVFNYHSDRIVNNLSLQTIAELHGAHNINIRDGNDADSKDGGIYVPLSLRNSLQLLKEDSNSRYFSENNSEFLKDTNLVSVFDNNGDYLRPSMVLQSEYDLQIGSQDATTPLRYNINYRNYYYAVEGNVQIRLAPPKSTKHVREEKDYCNFEFRSPICPWQVQPEYEEDFAKVECLDLTLKKGQVICIPAYWWYSIRFNASSVLAVFKYRTFMNTIAVLPRLAVAFLQTQNVKHKTVPTAKLSAPSKEKPEGKNPKGSRRKNRRKGSRRKNPKNPKGSRRKNPKGSRKS